MQQAVDQDGSLNDDQKQQKKHKIEKDIAAGVITAGLGYAVIYKMPPPKKLQNTTVYFVLFYFIFWRFTSVNEIRNCNDMNILLGIDQIERIIELYFTH